MARKIAGITDAAVVDATGRGWVDWLAVLDAAGGTDMDHSELVAALAEAGVERPWWQQQLAVGYELERGLREPGETATAGFQVGVQRTLPGPMQAVWELLTGPEGRAVWLGSTTDLAFAPGETYRTDEGTTGEIRTVDPGARLRLTWHPPELPSPSTLQLTLSCPRNTDERTTLRIHHERLVDGEQREAMRAHWRGVLDRLESLLAA